VLVISTTGLLIILLWMFWKDVEDLCYTTHSVTPHTPLHHTFRYTTHSVTPYNVFWYLSCIHSRCWHHIVIAVMVRLLLVVVQISCLDALQNRDSMSQCSSVTYDLPGLETGTLTRITFLCCALFKLMALRKVKLYRIIRDFRLPWQCRRGFRTAYVGSWSVTL
jgi:hypothetical protein